MRGSLGRARWFLGFPALAGIGAVIAAVALLLPVASDDDRAAPPLVRSGGPPSTDAAGLLAGDAALADDVLAAEPAPRPVPPQPPAELSPPVPTTGRPVDGSGRTTSAGGAAAVDAPEERSGPVRVGVLLRSPPAATLPVEPGSSLRPRDVEVFFDDLNARRKADERELVAVTKAVDPADETGVATACEELVEDAVVAAVSTIVSIDCLADNGVTVLVPNQTLPQRAHGTGVVFTHLPTAERLLRGWATALDRAGSLEGRKIGVLTQERDAAVEVVRRALLPRLDELGHEVRTVEVLSDEGGVASSQLPVAVSNMRAREVDAVLLAVDAATAAEFARHAAAQTFAPQWHVSDFGGLTRQEALADMPATFFDRADGTTSMRTGEERRGTPEPPPDEDCRATWEAATGETLERGSDAYGAVLHLCGAVRLLGGTLRGIQGQLRTDHVAPALREQRAVSLPFVGGTGSFGPAKSDAADHLRPLQADASCGCWLPAGDFRPMR